MHLGVVSLYVCRDHARLRARKLKPDADGACWLLLAPVAVLPSNSDIMTELPPPTELVAIHVPPVSVLLALSIALELATMPLGMRGLPSALVLIMLDPVLPLPKLATAL